MRTRDLILPILCLLAVATTTSAAAETGPTVEELVARCADAMSRSARIDELTTLRIEAVYPDHGDHVIPHEFRRPNQSYSPRSGLAFDGERACWLRGTDGESDPEHVAAEELVDFDLEIAWFYPAFFDHPGTYGGLEQLGGRSAHKLRVALPHGAQMTYLLDAETSLPAKVSAEFTRGGKAYRFERSYGEFAEVDGVLYPRSFTYDGRNGEDLPARIVSVEIDGTIDDAHFVVPAQCRAMSEAAE
jgi:hypothetical protein